MARKSKNSSIIEELKDLDRDLEYGEPCDTSTQESQDCCIYKVPEKLRDKLFKPRVVSIGPYYHYSNYEDKQQSLNLPLVQKLKRKFCSILLSHVEKSEKELMGIITPKLVAEARGHYSEMTVLHAEEDNGPFLKMLIRDGCFILELFRILGKSKKIESNHPLASVAWAIPQFYGDLLLLENQIPFVVLKKLFEISKMSDEDYPLSLLALRFFNKVMRRSDKELQNMSERLNDSLHLLDLVRSSFITPDLEKPPPKNEEESGTPVIFCISKLLKAGIKIELGEAADSFLDVKFENGVIKMPKITVDYFMHSFVVNCRAFEQLHKKTSTKHITVYAYLLDCLVNTAKDAEYLYEHNIIDSYVGKNSEVVQFINKLGKEIDVETDQFYLYNFFEKVNHRYNSDWRKNWAKFKRTYCNSPWSWISVFAAVVLLVLTLLQTYYTIYAYVNPNNGLNFSYSIRLLRACSACLP